MSYTTTMSPPNEPAILAIPQEVFDEIALYLPPKDFVHLCRANRGIWKSQHNNPTYWRFNVSATFRFPLSPLLHSSDDRWYSLYRRFRTETHAFSWGQGLDGQLGQPRRIRPGVTQPFTTWPSEGLANGQSWLPGARHPPAADLLHHELCCDREDRSWPSQMRVNTELGMVTDIQCGGWFTAVLNSEGKIFIVGSFGPDTSSDFQEFTQLVCRSTKPIRNFSAGRSHILGLDEDGLVWAWKEGSRSSMPIFQPPCNKVFKVVAGWGVGSALTKEGILYWPVGGRVGGVLPRLCHIPGSGPSSTPINTDQEPRGKVVNHIALEEFIVFLTDASQLFAHKICATNELASPVIELLAFSAPDRRLKDIQGSFRNFSIFTDDGKVLRGTQAYLDRLWELRRPDGLSGAPFLHDLSQEASSIPRPRDVPALQNSGVISISYGDHHYHALHEDGRITSYGSEPQSHPAFGLTRRGEGAALRGVINSWPAFRRDNTLSPVCYQKGRAVWFSDSQKAWLQHLQNCAQSESVRQQSSSSTDHDVTNLFNRGPYQIAAYSQWVEQEGAAWEEGTISDDGLPSYFAVSIAAGGWHSAALVMRNHHLVRKVDRKWRDANGDYVWKYDSLPRIRLPNGHDLPGSGPLTEWKGGMPPENEISPGFSASEF